MLKFAEIVQKIKNHKSQRGIHVLFLRENVKSIMDEDVMKFEQQFGISRLNIDVLQLSPVKWDRSYLTNMSAACSTISQLYCFSNLSCDAAPSFWSIPINELPAWNSAIGQSTTVNILAGGWMDPPQLYCHIRNEYGYSKANTSMASEGEWQLQ